MIGLEALVKVAKSAGEAILEIYQRGFSVTQKADQSPLTEADLAAHQLIVAELARLTPDIPVLSEESANIPYATRQQWHRYWLVDPLDGTKEFIRRNGEFTVNIALIEQGQPRLGVVYAPVLGDCYFGEVAQGAWKSHADGSTHPIQVGKPSQQPLRIVASRSHAGDSLKALLDKIGAHTLVSIGSSLKLCLIAEGKADFYPRLGPTSEWDTAAAQAVLEAAGGKVTDLALQPLRYNQKDTLLNPHFLAYAEQHATWLDWARSG